MAIAKKTAIATLVFGYCHTGVSLTDENSVAIAMVTERSTMVGADTCRDILACSLSRHYTTYCYTALPDEIFKKRQKACRKTPKKRQ